MSEVQGEEASTTQLQSSTRSHPYLPKLVIRLQHDGHYLLKRQADSTAGLTANQPSQRIAMATDIIRDAPIGQLLRWVTQNRILLYPEERPGFQLPIGYQSANATHKSIASSVTSPATEPTVSPLEQDNEKAGLEPVEIQSRHPSDVDRHHLERMVTAQDDEFHRTNTQRSDLEKAVTNRSHLSRTATRTTLEKIHTRADLDEAFRVASLARPPTQPIVPERTHEGLILVDFYTTDDPENPQNWTLRRKGVATLQICLYTFAVYLGSAIYTPSIPGIQEAFGVSITVASLGLALYVLAYGMGPLLFSPISEIPVVGRNPPYMVTMGIFVALCIAAPLVDNMAGLLVIRFLQGFFGSVSGFKVIEGLHHTDFHRAALSCYWRRLSWRHVQSDQAPLRPWAVGIVRHLRTCVRTNN